MPGYRQIHSRMWSSDQWFADLSKDQKLLFIYLFSNERASVSGLYELPLRVIAFETGLEPDEIRAGLEAFERAGKVSYDFERQVVWVHKMLKYQGSTSPKVAKRIKADVAAVPECGLKTHWLQEYSIDTVSVWHVDGMDTSSSISLSSSSFSSSSEEGGGTGEGTNIQRIPETPKQAKEHPDIQLYEQVCGVFPGSDNYRTIVETIQYLREQHGDGLVQYLAPYWAAWSTRRDRRGKPYNPKSLVWLGEWAMQGEIPRTNGHEPKTGENAIKNRDVIRKVAQRANTR